MNRIKLILIAFVLIASTSIASATDVSGWITSDTTWDLAGSPYNVTDDVTIVNSWKVKLTIDPGVVVNFSEGTLLWIGARGKLVADGTPDNKITFTGAKKTPGHWKGIIFGPASRSGQSKINNAIIEYGGYKYECDYLLDTCGDDGLRYANLILLGARPKINGSTIRNSAGDGILCIGSRSTPTITCNWITNNENGVHTLVGAKPTIKNNNICGNSEYGVLNELTTKKVNAKKNWWGDSSGPGKVGPGTGDNVSAMVHYNPWKGQPVPCAPIPELSSIILVAAGLLMLVGCARIGRRD